MLATAEEPPSQAGIAYGPLPVQRGDIYLPPNRPPRRRGPAILLIHGGGWIGGSRGNNAGFSAYLASEGFVVFNIDYRLGIQGEPDTHWPAPLEDCQLAVRWLKAHAAELGIDPARIAAVGDSAGGTLSLLLGMTRSVTPGPMQAVLPNLRPNVAAVVDQFGIVDLGVLAPRDMYLGMFGTATPAPEQTQALSLLPLVSRGDPPTLIVHGERDDFVPVGQSRDLLTALRGAGVAAEMITFDGGHGFAGLSGDAIAALFAQEAAWLKRHLGA